MRRAAGSQALAREARSRIAQAHRLVALTGPGLLPDDSVLSFSDCGTRLGGRSVAEIASPRPFFEDPVAVWRWYDERRTRLSELQPGAAHLALAAVERRAEAFTLATERVDGLHQRAGGSGVLELRGSVWHVRCTRCGVRSVNREIPIALPPACPICTGLTRPAIVWQGEQIPRDLLVRCFEALRTCQVLIVVGSPSRAQPAAAFAAVARRAGAYIVEIAAVPPREGSPANALFVGNPEEIVPTIMPPQG